MARLFSQLCLQCRLEELSRIVGCREPCLLNDWLVLGGLALEEQDPRNIGGVERRRNLGLALPVVEQTLSIQPRKARLRAFLGLP